jgi:hypothetical protein
VLIPKNENKTRKRKRRTRKHRKLKEKRKEKRPPKPPIEGGLEKRKVSYFQPGITVDTFYSPVRGRVAVNLHPFC